MMLGKERVPVGQVWGLTLRCVAAIALGTMLACGKDGDDDRSSDALATASVPQQPPQYYVERLP